MKRFFIVGLGLLAAALGLLPVYYPFASPDLEDTREAENERMANATFDGDWVAYHYSILDQRYSRDAPRSAAYLDPATFGLDDPEFSETIRRNFRTKIAGFAQLAD